MADYTKTTDFAAKDALASGNPAKTIVGTEFDDEFNNIATAIATKYDSTDGNVANGVAVLDGSALLLPAVIPQATTTAKGGGESATDAEAAAGTDATKLITADNLGANAGIVADLIGLADPNVDRLIGWDDSANSAIFFTLGNGLETDLTNARVDVSAIAGAGLDGTTSDLVIDVDMLGLEDLVDPNADRIFFWDDSAGISTFLTVTGGLEIDTTNLRLIDKAASTTDAIDITSGDITLDFSALTAIDIAGTQPTDSLVMNDGGVLKQIDIQDMGVRVVESTVAQTFALGDANTMQLLTGTTTRAFDIPVNSAVGFPIGTVIYVGSRDTASLTISPNTSAVTLTSSLRSGVGPTAGDHTVEAGGMAAIVKVATNEWMISGDIT